MILIILFLGVNSIISYVITQPLSFHVPLEKIHHQSTTLHKRSMIIQHLKFLLWAYECGNYKFEKNAFTICKVKINSCILLLAFIA